MAHPANADLELYACRDLRGMSKWLIERHVKRCDECTETVTRLQQFWQSVDWSLDIPDRLWAQLADEMRGNIHVGLSAAECVRPRLAPRAVPVPLLAAFASLLIIAAAGAYLNQPSAAPTSNTPVLETSGDGIQAREGSDILEFVNRSRQVPVRTVSAGGEMRSRYVDGDSGDVTIVNVYAQ